MYVSNILLDHTGDCKERFVSDLQWFSPGNQVSYNNKADLHVITEILFKVVLNTIHQTINLPKF
jgi:hypothetical protein